MNNVRLNFINRSNEANNSEIVIYQKNMAEGINSMPVAWKVIRNCGRLDNHPFTFSTNYQVSAGDSFGNYTPLLMANTGMAFEMIKDNSGDVLQQSSSPTSNPNTIEIKNSLSQGVISGGIYRDEKLLAIKTNVVPEEKAVFEFQPKIFIGVASSVEEGQVINSAIISSINTEISLFGISSADIVMTGGGTGANATPFEFTLENIVSA